MDKKEIIKISIIKFGLICLFVIVCAVFIAPTAKDFNDHTKILEDLNVLKSNDLAFAQYITANSQTLEYLNKNCKVTSDTNEVTILTCLKVKN